MLNLLLTYQCFTLGVGGEWLGTCDLHQEDTFIVVSTQDGRTIRSSIIKVPLYNHHCNLRWGLTYHQAIVDNELGCLNHNDKFFEAYTLNGKLLIRVNYDQR